MEKYLLFYFSANVLQYRANTVTNVQLSKRVWTALYMVSAMFKTRQMKKKKSQNRAGKMLQVKKK